MFADGAAVIVFNTRRFVLYIFLLVEVDIMH